jgi:hypothetical protein
LSPPSRMSSNPPPNAISPIKSKLKMSGKMISHADSRQVEHGKDIRKVAEPCCDIHFFFAGLQSGDELLAAANDDFLVALERGRTETFIPELAAFGVE